MWICAEWEGREEQEEEEGKGRERRCAVESVGQNEESGGLTSAPKVPCSSDFCRLNLG